MVEDIPKIEWLIMGTHTRTYTRIPDGPPVCTVCYEQSSCHWMVLEIHLPLLLDCSSLTKGLTHACGTQGLLWSSMGYIPFYLWSKSGGQFHVYPLKPFYKKQNVTHVPIVCKSLTWNWTSALQFDMLLVPIHVLFPSFWLLTSSVTNDILSNQNWNNDLL